MGIQENVSRLEWLEGSNTQVCKPAENAGLVDQQVNTVKDQTQNAKENADLINQETAEEAGETVFSNFCTEIKRFILMR